MVNAHHILVVDDEPDLVELVSYNLKKEGYAVSSAADGEEALKKIRGGGFSLIVLDLMLPGIQGMDLCRMLREDPSTAAVPIIMLTARADETDKVLGLELGADDYVTKPFGPRELVARIRAVLRRVEERPEEEKTVRVGDLAIDKQTYTVTKRGNPLRLSSTEFNLLLFLVERRGRVFSREQLLSAVWKDDAFVEPRTVDVHIRRLRTHVEDDPSSPRYIKTRRGIGYLVEKDA